jgi:hypothetical protein
MVIYGLGMGFTSAPATESIMGAVSRHKAGVGSAVNDATRLLGGTLGVAVIGSVYASLYGSRLDAGLPTRLPGALTHAAHQSVGAALSVANGLSAAGRPGLAATVQHTASTAFIHGLSVSCLVAGGVAAFGALMAAVLLPSQPPAPEPRAHDQEARPVEEPAMAAGPAVA